MKNFIKDHWQAILVFIFANVAMFWPVYFKGLIPFPGDLLVSFFFPWNTGGFPGFNSWTTHKEYLAADAIRQIFVWKSLGFSLWNPYNFSGSFLFANLQSSFLSVSSLIGWVPTVMVIMSLFGFFTYLFLRSLNLSRMAAIFGGLAAANISYLTGWQEILVNVQSALFLPLILLLINKNKTLLASIFLAFSIFGGHIQTALYVYLIAGLFAVYKKSFRLFVASCLLSVGLAAVQLVPTIEAYLLSARETPANVDLLIRTTFPWQGLITYFVSDFFGNTASFNFRLFNYADARAYIGLIAAVFSLFSFYLLKDKNVKFFLFLTIFGLLLATWPGGLLFIFLKIPILSSVVPARMIMASLFAAAILSAYGFEYFLRHSGPSRILLPVLVFFISLWLYVFFIKTPDTLISRNNLIIPTGVFIVLTGVLFLVKKFPKLIVIIFLLAILEPAYYFVKHQPFSSPTFVFPPHPVFQFLQKNAGINRFYGSGQAYIDNNFATFYHIYSAEGYDPLYIKRYGELIYSSTDGKYHPDKVPRSDSKFVERNNFYRNRLFDLLGVKYILDRENQPKDGLAWLERESALPRIFLADDYIIESDPQKILDKIYSPDFDLRKTVVLEESVAGLHPATAATDSGQVKMMAYEPNKIVLETQSDSPKILFLSDSFYPGWKAFIDSTETKIYRADYSFRAVPVPSGPHQIIFQYDPMSFKIGVTISLISSLILIIVIAIQKPNQKSARA